MLHRSAPLAAAFLLTLSAVSAVTAADPPAITPAPAFTSQQLLAPPGDAWVTNGDTLYNQRYSPLTLINPDNVKNLRALWRYEAKPDLRAGSPIGRTSRGVALGEGKV